MKNFLTLTTPDQVFNYVGSLWRSPIFQESQNNPNGYIYTLIKGFSQTPRIFFDMHLESMEMVHFSSWFQAIQHRPHYTNDILHDLYYHHEFFHLSTMPYSKTFTFESWQKKMKENEFWASLESEVYIYFYLPELREQSFAEEIWADKFLKNELYNPLYGKYSSYKTQASEIARLTIATARDICETQPITELDKQIQDYTVSSNEWADIWNRRESWQKVETHIFHYLQELKTNPDKAVSYHLSWLKELQEQDKDGIAFGEEARAYTAVHRRLFQSAYNPAN